MMPLSELNIEKKTCRICDETKIIDDFPINRSWYYSKSLGQKVEYAKRRHVCRTCLSQQAYAGRIVKMQREAKTYKAKDISNLQGARASVVNHLKNGCWISVIQDIGTLETERLVTNGEDDFMLVHLSTMRWLQKYQVIQEVKVPQRTTLLIEQKFILAKQYENEQQPKLSSYSNPAGSNLRTPVNG
jgi:hypothetical protein